ncbi:MAG: hypothetical protein E7632_04485 [Ruminococcaceae bacterium]|nr:hypothetical protein [Oscillospiraceae bacterium]
MIKMIIASAVLAAMMICFAGCTEKPPETGDAGAPFSVNTVEPPAAVPTETEPAEVLPAPAELPAESPRAVILTYGNEDSFTLDGTLDYDAFLDWLADYYGSRYDEPMVIAVRDIIDNRGAVTVLAEYHTMEALESGRSVGTVCGSCNFFFHYDTATGLDFSESDTLGALLHNHYIPEPLDLTDWTASVDSQGFVQLVKAGETPIKTPAEYRWNLYDFADVHRLYVNGDRIMLVLLEHPGEQMDIVDRKLMMYVSDDGGESWQKTEIDYTPTTTTVRYPVTDLVLSMRDDDRGALIVGTNRCEVFFYTTEDGGKTWQKQRNFKLKNYRYGALLDGGLVTDTLGFVTFEARDRDNPNVYITKDGGKTWNLMDINPPDETVDGWVEFCKHRGYPVNAFDGEWEAYALGARLEDGPSGGDTVVSIPVYVNGERFFDYVSHDFGESWHWGITFGKTREDDGTISKWGLEISYLEEKAE